MTNLKPIKKGADYWFQIKIWADRDKTSLLDISGYNITVTASYANGTVAFTKNNAALTQLDINRRLFSLTDTETAALTVGEVYYQIDAVRPDTINEELANGYIIISA